ncbi:hypothetical protein BH11ARM1_BH11ARM1_17020 [soil metagenome]
MLFFLPSLAPNTAWYGPATVTFSIQVPGNPFDPAQNDLMVKFLPAKGAEEDRIAYVDFDGTIKATLVTQNPGRFRAVLYRNGKEMMEPPAEGIFSITKPLAHGFIRVDPEAKNRFRWDDGTPYYPMGFNLGWQSEGLLPLSEQIAKMGQNGVNWTRVWASNWDGKNPWWPQNDLRANKEQLWPKALDNWDDVVISCETASVPFQMVLFNHGSFSSKVNPNWPDHPFNAKNGGFLKDAADFFTDSEAKRRTKMWLRYAVARWGSSADIMAWELFNEVEWVDARYAERWPDIVSWHKEMAEYMRSIDPYHHLITTSSAMNQKALWDSVDYYQPHTYPSNVLTAVNDIVVPDDKPLFFGEFGPPAGEGFAAGIRDGIYGAMLANQAGAAQFWAWDEVEKQNLYPIFKTASEVIVTSDLGKHPTARRLDLRVGTADVSAMALGESDWLLMRVKGSNSPATISGLSLADGNYDMTEFDLVANTSKTSVVRVGNFTYSLPLTSQDLVLTFKRKL